MTMYIHSVCDGECHRVCDGVCHRVGHRVIDGVGMKSLTVWGDVKNIDGVRGVGLRHGDGFQRVSPDRSSVSTKPKWELLHSGTL